MRYLKKILLATGVLVGLLIILFVAIMGYGIYSNATKSLELTRGNASTLALLANGKLENLLEEAKRTHTDALVIYKDGQLVGAWHSNGQERPMDTMSVTKSFMNLVVGRAFTMGYIDSLDEPMSTFIPEWSKQPYHDITLRHILGHSSGIAGAKGPVYLREPDSIAFAVNSPVLELPGSMFQYSNITSNLVPLVILEATDQTVDEFAREHLLSPMGITDVSFQKDDAGNIYGATGLNIFPTDLAKLAQLALDRGMFKSERLIDDSWFDESFTPTTKYKSNFGLSWWLNHNATYVIDEAHLAYLREIGASNEFMVQVSGLVGTYNKPELNAAVTEALGEAYYHLLQEEIGSPSRIARPDLEDFHYFEGNGSWGQRVIGIPSSGIVAVRLFDVDQSATMLYRELIEGEGGYGMAIK